MAISQDSSTPAVVVGTGSTGTTLTTASFSPPAGSLLAVAVSYAYLNVEATGPTLAISDSVSGSYPAGPAVYDGGGEQASIWTRYLTSAPGSMTVTVTNTVDTTEHGWILTVYVLDGAAPSQTGAGSNTASSDTNGTAWTGSITTTQPGSWVLVACSSSTEATLTPNGSTSTLENEQDATDGASLLTGKQTSPTGTPGATTLGWTSGTSGAYSWAALEILPAAPGVARPVQPGPAWRRRFQHPQVPGLPVPPLPVVPFTALFPAVPGSRGRGFPLPATPGHRHRRSSRRTRFSRV